MSAPPPPDLLPYPRPFAGLAAGSSGRRMLRILRWAVPALVMAYLAYRLTQLGWREIWRARPGNAGFYLALVAQFFLQPLGDFCVYRNLWGARNRPPLSVILRKRFLNSAMLDYSGELFFYFWAQARLKLPQGLLIHSIKDSNLLSAGAGLTMVWLIGLILLTTGGLHFPHALTGHAWLYVAAGSLPLLLCLLLVAAHRKVTVLTRRQIGETFAIHFLRCLLVLAVEFGLWTLSGVLPSAVACLQFVALRLVVTRLPLFANKDLIFVGAGIAAAGLSNIAVTPVATVLVILAAADLVLASSVAGLPWALEHVLGRRKTGEAAP